MEVSAERELRSQPHPAQAAGDPPRVTCGQGGCAGKCMRRHQPPALVPYRLPVTVCAPEASGWSRAAPAPRVRARGTAHCASPPGAGRAGEGAGPGRGTRRPLVARGGGGAGAGGARAAEDRRGRRGGTRCPRAAGAGGRRLTGHRETLAGEGRALGPPLVGWAPTTLGRDPQPRSAGKIQAFACGRGKEEELGPQKVLLPEGEKEVKWEVAPASGELGAAEPWGGVQGPLPHARGAERPAPFLAGGIWRGERSCPCRAGPSCGAADSRGGRDRASCPLPPLGRPRLGQEEKVA